MAFSYNDIKSALDQAKAATGGKFVAFDAAYYVQRYSIVKDENGAILDNSLASFTGDPLKHYVETGAAKGYAPNAWFDATFYRAQYADVRDGYTNADLIAHYALFGAYEGRAPSSLLATFDGERYLRDNPEVADYVNGNLGQFGGSATNGAIAHFVLFGAQEGRHGYTTAGADTGFTFVPKTATIAPVTTGNITELSLNTNGGATTLVGNNAIADGDAATAGADTLRLVGDADVRIDMTNPANQLRGVDLNGDGTIAANGIENNVSGVQKVTVKNFEIVDAYARNPLNEGDRAHNFTGDIAYDGTGFDGDGVSTDGNIVLGGIGADTIKGGIGNDFIAGGGVTTGRAARDDLSGGRNADFFFAELSELDNTDGNSTNIDGGLTSDDSAAGNVQTAQDSDWLLLEASDDDEPVTIDLENGNVDSDDGDLGAIRTRDGVEVATLYDIENLNASGNLYGFLNGVDVEMGGRRLDSRDVAGAENYGLGSSAQLNVDGSRAANIIIAGYDNDNIVGNDGNDLLFGGDLRYIKTHANNPNLANITNDGMDYLYGGDDNDSLVLELDRGVVDGGDEHDTVYLTDYTIARKAATEAASNEDMLADGKIRLDLGYVDYDGYRGYNDLTAGDNTSMRLPGRHDTADQTNYKAGNTVYTTIVDNDSIVATGLGDIDYKAAGSNDPELNFANQQNYSGINANLELRGTNTGDSRGASFTTGVSTVVTTSSILNVSDINNVLYANTGNDVVEGREGNDLLSGGNGFDDFVFGTANAGVSTGIGDGVDVIWRQKDAVNNVTLASGADGLWDVGTKGNGWTDETRYVGDFGQESATSGATQFRMTLTDQNDATETGASASDISDDKELDAYITAFESITFTLGSEAVAVNLASTALTYAAVVDAINAVLEANPAFKDKVTARIDALDPNSIIVEDVSGRTFGETADAKFTVRTPANTTWTAGADVDPDTFVRDRLVFKAYEDRLDNEGVDDDSFLGSTVSLGTDSYAEDRVVGFDPVNGTRIAESQKYKVILKNLTTEDIVTLTVNGVKYELQVGVDLDGNRIADEDGGTQLDIQTAFALRLEEFINSFMDDDTAAGAVDADLVSTILSDSGSPDLSQEAVSTINLTQRAYSLSAAETVFMTAPTVSIQNKSGGEPASYSVANISEHEVLLYQYDGRDGNLHRENVLFVGEEFERNGSTADNSRSILETAKNDGGTLTGSEAMVLDGLADDLMPTVQTDGAAIANNQATRFGNFSVHGDDLLIGGNGVDAISAGTGDDRVIGSKGSSTAPTIGGTDGERIDGGADFYAVQVLGEDDARVYVKNTYEAANLTIAGETISSITPIQQTESGNGLQALYGADVAGLSRKYAFDDTLLFQQADFVVGTTQFTVTLDDYALDDGMVVLTHGGAGLVSVDNNADGLMDSYTRFTNFENIRTVSGIGKAVAGDGQGEDTLNVSALSTSTGGILYNLTAGVEAGKVEYSTDAFITGSNLGTATGDKPAEGDYDALVIRVDGVENVHTGTGNDLLIIDETEAAKDNEFSASTGLDRIVYANDYDTEVPEVPAIAEPTVTIKVNSATDTDTVIMQGGRVGTLATETHGAVDTLTGVELIAVTAETATNAAENDLIDVTAMTAGAVVDYTNGEIRTAGSLAGSNVQVVIEGITQFERVHADGNDTVIIDNAMANAREDVTDANAGVYTDQSAAEDVEQRTFIDFDDLTTDSDDNVIRQDFGADPADILEVRNQNQYEFRLSETGSGSDSDTVDYKAETGLIVAVANFDELAPVQTIMVSHDGDLVFNEDDDRVDALYSVENVVAATGTSILDLTNATQDLKITFSSNYDRVANYNSSYATGNGLEIHQIAVTGTTVGAPELIDMNYLDYVFVDTTPTNPAGDPAVMASAYWNRIEGSDFNEVVELSGWEASEGHTLNLRGGSNRVNYEGDRVDVEINVIDPVAGQEATTGLVQVTADHYAPQDQHDGNQADDPIVMGTDIITSYSAQNAITTGSLTIKGARGDEDSITFNAGLAEKYFVLGGVVDATSAITVTIGADDEANSLQLVGFELLTDADTDDVYDMGDLGDLLADLTLTDTFYNNVGGDDHDTVMVEDDAVDYGLAPANTISLEVINDTFAFDFDVLDITQVTDDNLIIVGDNPLALRDLADDVVLGNLDLIDSAAAGVTLFETIWLTNASITSAGTTYVLDIDNGTLYDDADLGAGDVLFDTDSANLNFSRVTGSNLNISVVSAAAAAELTGGAGNDTITGAGGDDVLTGGAGNDTLDGSFVAEVHEVQTVIITGAFGVDASNDGTIEIGGITLTEDVAAVAGANVLDGSDADTIGAAFDAIDEADWETALGLAAGEVDSVAYNATSNTLSFTFASGVNPAAGFVLAASTGYTANTDTGAIAIGAGTDVDHADQAESADTYVFAATAALNGVDTLNNVDDSDTIDFSAFFGATALSFGAAQNAGAADINVDDNLVSVAYNLAALTADNVDQGDLADGEQAVVIVTADDNGTADPTLNPYLVYFVEDGAVAGDSDFTVTLVGTINGNTANAELTAAQIIGLL